MALLDSFPFHQGKLKFQNYDGYEEDYAEELSSEALYTSIEDWKKVLAWIKENIPKTKLIDLGAGEARGSVIASLEFPNLSISSIEYHQERFKHSIAFLKEHGVYQNNIFQGNFLEHPLENYDAFFLYLPVNKNLYHLFERFFEISQKKKITLFCIESHGDLIPFIEDYFEDANAREKLPLNSIRHDQSLHIFEIEKPKKNFTQEIISFRNQNKKITVKELHPTLGSYTFERKLKDGPKKGHITVANPQRLISLKNIVSIDK